LLMSYDPPTNGKRSAQPQNRVAQVGAQCLLNQQQKPLTAGEPEGRGGERGRTQGKEKPLPEVNRAGARRLAALGEGDDVQDFREHTLREI